MRPGMKSLWTFSQPDGPAEGPPSKRRAPCEEHVPAEREKRDAAGEPGEAKHLGPKRRKSDRPEQHGDLCRGEREPTQARFEDDEMNPGEFEPKIEGPESAALPRTSHEAPYARWPAISQEQIRWNDLVSYGFLIVAVYFAFRR